MNELFGQVFSIAKKHPPVEGCTISKSVNQGENAIFYFSLAENTDISAEIFPYHKFIYVLEGSVTICQQLLKTGDSILTPCEIPVGMETKTSVVYLEIELPKSNFISPKLPIGKVFSLPSLLKGNTKLTESPKLEIHFYTLEAGKSLTFDSNQDLYLLDLAGQGSITDQTTTLKISDLQSFCIQHGTSFTLETKDPLQLLMLKLQA